MRIKPTFSQVLAGTIVFLAVAFGAACDFMDEGDFDEIFGGKEYTEDFNKTLPLKAGESLDLRNLHGFVHITTWNRDDVEIQAKKIARRRQEDLSRVKIEVEAGSSGVRVETVYEKYRNIRVNVNYEIKVPEGVRLEKIGSTHGDIEIAGRYPDVKAETTHGDIQVKGGDGRIDLSTTHGSIVLELDAVKEDIQAGTTHGSITLRLGGQVNADLRAQTTHGSINVDFPVTLQSGSSSNRHLQGRIGNGGRMIELETTHGSIHVKR